MALKRFMERLRMPVEDLDRAGRAAFFEDFPCTPMNALELPQRTLVAGEVSSVRIVPRAGAPAVEVEITDGRGTVTGVFLGRRKVHGIAPGRRLTFEGLAARHDNQVLIYNPVYEFIPTPT